INKIDKMNSSIREKILPRTEDKSYKRLNNSFLSVTTDEGMNIFLEKLSLFVVNYFGTEPKLISRERQRHYLDDARAALNRALSPEVRSQEDLMAEELRRASHSLGRLLGRVDVEDILDVIFRDFCIGK